MCILGAIRNYFRNVKSFKNKTIKTDYYKQYVENKKNVTFDCSKNTRFTNNMEKILADNKLKIIKSLGCGAYSKVYKVIDVSRNEYVCKCVKKYNPRSGMREISVLNKLKGNDFFPHYQFHLENDSHMLIFTKYNDSEELFEYVYNLIDRRELDEQKIIKIFLNMTKAVKELHSLGFLHLDIKMENFILIKNSDYKVKLIDFDMSRTYCEDFKRISTSIGTKGYSPIESYNGFYNNKTDIWSLGICLWILLSENMPFEHRYISTRVLKNPNNKRFIFSPHEEDVKNINKDAMDLMKQLLNIYPKERISIDNIISHKWFNN